MIATCHIGVLLVEDSPTDVEITRRALDRAGAPVRLHVVRDGEEALDFLYRRGRHAGCSTGQEGITAAPSPAAP